MVAAAVPLGGVLLYSASAASCAAGAWEGKKRKKERERERERKREGKKTLGEGGERDLGNLIEKGKKSNRELGGVVTGRGV